jgi:hypothetical protein
MGSPIARVLLCEWWNRWLLDVGNPRLSRPHANDRVRLVPWRSNPKYALNQFKDCSAYVARRSAKVNRWKAQVNPIRTCSHTVHAIFAIRRELWAGQLLPFAYSLLHDQAEKTRRGGCPGKH